MLTRRFARNSGGEVELDLCFPCQGLWFDTHESMQLAAAGVIGLFGLIHDHRDDLRLPLAARLHCPRCPADLVPARDFVKGGRFNYHRCAEHGRFIAFGQFMIEKGFVRELTRGEIARLAASVGVVHCSGCGAPVDIRNDDACSHCHAPIAVLDPAAVDRALAGYREAVARAAMPSDPGRMADALIAAERERSRHRRESGAVSGPEIGDLLLDGVAMVWSMLDS